MNHKDKEMLYRVLTARSRLQFLERDIHIHLQVVGVPQQRSAHFTQTLFLFLFSIPHKNARKIVCPPLSPASAVFSVLIRYMSTFFANGTPHLYALLHDDCIPCLNAHCVLCKRENAEVTRSYTCGVWW